jgi:hypothetical protein
MLLLFWSRSGADQFGNRVVGWTVQVIVQIAPRNQMYSLGFPAHIRWRPADPARPIHARHAGGALEVAEEADDLHAQAGFLVRFLQGIGLQRQLGLDGALREGRIVAAEAVGRRRQTPAPAFFPNGTFSGGSRRSCRIPSS